MQVNVKVFFYCEIKFLLVRHSNPTPKNYILSEKKKYKRRMKFATNSFSLHRKQKIKKDSNLSLSPQGS